MKKTRTWGRRNDDETKAGEAKYLLQPFTSFDSLIAMSLLVLVLSNQMKMRQLIALRPDTAWVHGVRSASHDKICALDVRGQQLAFIYL